MEAFRQNIKRKPQGSILEISLGRALLREMNKVTVRRSFQINVSPGVASYYNKILQTSARIVINFFIFLNHQADWFLNSQRHQEFFHKVLPAPMAFKAVVKSPRMHVLHKRRFCKILVL